MVLVLAKLGNAVIQTYIFLGIPCIYPKHCLISDFTFWLQACLLFCRMSLRNPYHLHARIMNRLLQFEGFVHERRNSIANALLLRLPCTNPSSYSVSNHSTMHRCHDLVIFVLFLRLQERSFPYDQLDSELILVQIIAWGCRGDKPLCEKVGTIYWHIYASLGLNKLKQGINYFCPKFCYFLQSIPIMSRIRSIKIFKLDYSPISN